MLAQAEAKSSNRELRNRKVSTVSIARVPGTDTNKLFLPPSASIPKAAAAQK
jgi:hypothetical protein